MPPVHCCKPSPASGAAFAAEALTLPGESTLADASKLVNPDALRYRCPATACANTSRSNWKANSLGFMLPFHPTPPYAPTSEQAGRALRNVCLSYLSNLIARISGNSPLQQYTKADNNDLISLRHSPHWPTSMPATVLSVK